jgi:N-acetyl sugar amidotransferase
MAERAYQQCSRCVMDTSDYEIKFDAMGYCNHCSNYYDNTVKLAYSGADSDSKLARIVDKIKRKGKKSSYDCLLGISGGIDSCYTAYILKTLGLRVLLVHLDNGWNSELAVSNIKLVAEKLGFDYESYVLDWDTFSDLQLSFLKASVVEAETPTDIAIAGAVHRTAVKYNIKYIISGGNTATEGILPALWHYDSKDVTYLKAIHKKFGSKKLNNFPSFGYSREIYCKFVKGIRMVYILSYLPFNKDSAKQLLETEFGWKYYEGKHHESKFTAFIHSYFLPTKFNLDYRRATLSTQICAGTITREQALEQLKLPPYQPQKAAIETEYICKKLGISIDEFMEILHAPPKSYKDYPNDERKLKFIYRIYKQYFARDIAS